MPDEPIAVPSTAPADIDVASDAALAENDFSRYQAIENARDQNKPIPEAPAPSAKTETPAPSEGANKTAGEKKAPKTGEDRKTELAAEIQALLKQRAELQGKIPAEGDKKADPPPAAEIKPVPSKADAKDKAPVEPKLEDFASYAEYQTADRKWVRELVQFETRQVIQTSDANKAAAAQNKVLEENWSKRVEEARGEHADFADVAFSTDTPISPAMDGYILKCPIGPKVLYRLGENGSAEGKRIFALDPYDAVEALIEIKNELAGAAKKETPVKRQTTAAPAPATDLGARNTEPGDAILAALSRGDTGEYIRLSNARDLKLRRAA